ncbi:MAG: hypothetical protein KDC85_13165 [Saprospiraceae bacterium]|nr:hypothetical protein [Saprospiraceae bacterium]MCB9325509.1 hypothetical protein [Lewinellaceae bacterium]
MKRLEKCAVLTALTFTPCIEGDAVTLNTWSGDGTFVREPFEPYETSIPNNTGCQMPPSFDRCLPIHLLTTPL